MNLKVLRKLRGRTMAAIALSLCAMTCAGKTISENVTLSANTDWSGEGTVTIEEGATLDLNGYNLVVKGLDCRGSITSSPKAYKYYRFKVDAYPSCNEFQTGEIKLYSGDELIPNGQGRFEVLWRDNIKDSDKGIIHPDRAFDGSLDGECKWFDKRDLNDVWVILKFNEPTQVTKYEWYTAGDTTSYPRNPTAWRFQASNDDAASSQDTWNDVDWIDLDVVTGATCTLNNKTLAYAGYTSSGLVVDITGDATYSVSGSCTAPVLVRDCTLTTDVDLTCFGDNLKIAGNVDLAGNNLFVKGLDCRGSITSSPKAYKYYRFKVDAYPSCNQFQTGEIKLYRGNELIPNGEGRPFEVLWLDNRTGNQVNDIHPDRAFDGRLDNEFKWFDNRDLNDVWVILKFNEPTPVAKYEWYTANDTWSYRRNPTAWRFQASNDDAASSQETWNNVAWIDLDVVTGATCTENNETLAYAGDTRYTMGLVIDITGDAQYTVSGSCTAPVLVRDCTLTADADLTCFGDNLKVVGTVDLAGHKLKVSGLDGQGVVTSHEAAGAPPSYRFFRFKVDAAVSGSAIQISELKLFAGDADITGLRTAFYDDGSPYSEGEAPEKVVDGKTETKWYDEGDFANFWVTLEYAEPQQVTSYKWYTANDTYSYTGRQPYSWSLMGSNDNVHWTDLDVQVDRGTPNTSYQEAYAGYIYVNDGSEVEFEVPAGQTRTFAGVKLKQCVKLVKTGEGTLVVAARGNEHRGGTVVAEGILKPGVKGDTSIFGAMGSKLVVESGAQFLDDIHCEGSTAGVNWEIAGTGPDGTGAIKTPANTSGDNASVAWGRGLSLADDALILRDGYAFDFRAKHKGTFRMGLNGHTLTLLANVDSPWFLSCSVLADGEGTLAIGDHINFAPYNNYVSQFRNATIVVAPGASYTTGDGETDPATQGVIVSNFVYRSASTISQKREPTYVLGSYTPASTTSAPKVVLGDADHLNVALDLSERSVPFDVAFGGGMTFADNSTVSVKLGTRNCRSGECLVVWSEEPDATFVSTNPLIHFESRPDGLYISSGTLIFVR